MGSWGARDLLPDGNRLNAEVESTDHESPLYRAFSDRGVRRNSLTRLAPEARNKALVDGLCRSCYETASRFLLQSMTAADLRSLGPRHIGDIKLTKESSSCPLCNFLSSVAYSAARHGEGGVRPGVYSECSLHASTFSEVFFDAQDRRWFSDCDPIVIYISPLYVSGPKAISWSLRHNTCFMPLGGSGPSGVFARELSPQADLGVVRDWISHCNHGHTHPDCNPPSSLHLPGFLVIDCETRALVTWPSSTPYVTLSYVWGSDPAEAPDDDGRLPQTLPQLVEDAINVTSFLGYRYLWIDRYCVPQDDEAVKTCLILNMDKIYTESALTIIASASERPSEGLSGVGMSRTELPYSLRMGDLGLTQIFTNLADEVEKSRWNTRGWTYQEGFLSNRRLLFTKSQCYFQCGELWCTDGIRIPLDTLSSLNSPGQSKLSRVFPWVTNDRSVLDSVHLDRRRQREDYFVERVREYMKRELTHDKDAFNAFAGVLNYLKWFSGEFLLGDILGLPLWNTESRWSAGGDGRDVLLRSLAWGLTVPDHPDGDGPLSEVAERRSGLPSWTWCGWRLSSPFSRRVEWSQGWRSQEHETSAQIEMGFDFEDGDVIQRSPACQLAEVLEKTGNQGIVRVLRIRGWLSELVVPFACWHTNYDGECQCGPYRLSRRDVRYLSTVAERRGLPLTDRGYVLKMWFFSPLAFDLAEDNCLSKVMVLVESVESGTYERLDILCQIKMEYFIGRPSIEDMARRFRWELAEFGLG